MSHHHGGTSAPTLPDAARVALVGSPNAGKTTLFNGLTGLRAKTGNYPGVTVSRYEGRVETPAGPVVVEDLPGTYSLDPISPDEEIVAQVLDEADELTWWSWWTPRTSGGASASSPRCSRRGSPPSWC